MKRILLKIVATLSPTIAISILLLCPIPLVRELLDLFTGDYEALGGTIIYLSLIILSLGYLAVVLKFDKENYK